MEKQHKPIIRLTQEAVQDYIKCPNFFKMKYATKLPSKDDLSYHDLLQNVINAYLAHLMDGKVMTMDKVKNKWDKLVDEHKVSDRKILDGIGYFNVIHNYCKTNKVIIADMNTPYEITFKDNIIINGNIGTIRYNNNKFELFVIETSQKTPEQILLDMSLKYTFQIYALNDMKKNDKIDFKISGVRIFHVKSGHEFTTYRTKKDFDRLEKTINAIGKAIRNDIFYPREDHMCPVCNFKNYCGYL
jgi:CRISPR/Cas system-associated exonuclease Cas4 (RecB family)